MMKEFKSKYLKLKLRFLMWEARNAHQIHPRSAAYHRARRKIDECKIALMQLKSNG